MVKPSTMSVKEHIYRKMADDLGHPHATIKVVLDNQFRTALSALKDNNSLEIAGFGKLLINLRLLKKEIKELEFTIPYYKGMIKDPTTARTDRFRCEEYLEQVIKKLAELKGHLNKYEESHKNDKKRKSRPNHGQ